MDYRYMPEPDILPIVLDDDFIAECKASLVELPVHKRQRYLGEFGLKDDDARILTADYELSNYFDALCQLTNDPKKSCSFLTTVLLALMNESEEGVNFQTLKFDIKELARVIDLVNADELSSTNSKQVVEELFAYGGQADLIIDENELRQKNDL